MSLISAVAALSSFFEVGAITITSGGLVTLAHGLGVAPKLMRFNLVNTIAEQSWLVGNEAEFTLCNNDDANNNRYSTAYSDATNIYVRFSPSSNVFRLANKSTGASFNITNANWQLYVRAWA